MKKIILSLMALASVLLTTSCKNGDIEYDDFDYQTVYFAHQNVVRPIILGTDVYPREDDNNHEFKVYATVGGVWKNKTNRTLQIAVDNSIIEGKNLKNIAINGAAVADGEILPLPSNYYELGGNTITIPAGEVMGAVNVKLTDAFFNDPKSTKFTYVLPLRIVSANDSILDGKDYILYAVHYNNKYSGTWLTRGKDEVTVDGTTTTITRNADYVEKLGSVSLFTKALNQVRYPVSYTVNGKTWNADLLLTFDGSENCSVTSATEGVTVSGSGKWAFEAATKAWGDKDRDQIDLTYNITFADGTKVSSTDQLIARDRGTENRAMYFTYSE